MSDLGLEIEGSGAGHFRLQACALQTFKVKPDVMQNFLKPDVRLIM